MDAARVWRRRAGYASLDEAKLVTGALMSLYNAVNASVSADTPTVPVDCVFREDVLTNLDDDAPIGQWSRGFMRGHTWLEELWESYVPDELDEESAATLLTLSFFASRRIAEADQRDPGGFTSSRPACHHDSVCDRLERRSRGRRHVREAVGEVATSRKVSPHRTHDVDGMHNCAYT